MANSTACSTNTPKLLRRDGTCVSTSFKLPLGTADSGADSGGTAQITTAMPPMANRPVSMNKPDKPAMVLRAGAKTKDKANINPMLAPIKAMALVRTMSRVWSANKAVTTAETAPAPCKARPMSKPYKLSEAAAQKLPTARMTKPKRMTFLRPNLSDAAPNASCRAPCVSP